MMPMPKGLVLNSGGLDSQLAIGVLKRQDIAVEAVTFLSYFSDGYKAGRLGYWPRRAAEHFDIPLHFVFLRDAYVAMLRDPRYGFGAACNPCIDCKILMLRRAEEKAREIGASFIATGEVIGQRPMSQVKQSLHLIEKRAGLEGRVVRPLSGKLLEATIPEQEGLLARDLFEDITGRGRKRQEALAKTFSIAEFPQPAGGCILTDAAYAAKCEDSLRHGFSSGKEFIALQCGRVFRFDSAAKCIAGRNQRECEMLSALAEETDILGRLSDEAPGPLVVLKGEVSDRAMRYAAQIIKYYSKQRKEETSSIDFRKKESLQVKRVTVSSIDPEELKAMEIR